MSEEDQNLNDSDQEKLDEQDAEEFSESTYEDDNEDQEDIAPQTLEDEEWAEAENIMNMSSDEFKEYIAKKHPEGNSTITEDKTTSKNESNDLTEGDTDQEQENTLVEDKKESTDAAKPSQNPSTTAIPQGQWTVERILTEGFKANGKVVVPKSLDDVVRMAQQGYNYTPKMEKLKPMMRVMQTLNAANIHETELNDMLNVWKGEPEAVKKFLKDRNIEPTELDMENITYTPSNYLATDNDAEFAEVAQEVRASEHNAQIQNVINNVFDASSKSMILNSPVVLKGLLEEFNMGRFDQIMQTVQYDKALKRVPIITDTTTGQPRPMHDIEYYSHIAREFEARALQQQNSVQQTIPKQQMQQPAVKGKLQIPIKTTHLNKPSGANLSKASVAPTGRKIGGATKTNIDPYAILEMDDTDFRKLSIRDLIAQDNT